MRKFVIAMFLGALLAASATAQSVRFYAMPEAAPVGQEIIFTLQNNTASTLYVDGAKPFAVADANQKVIYQLSGLPITMPLAPGKSAIYFWTQTDFSNQQVKPGLYTGVTEYATSPSGKKIRVYEQVQVDDIILGASGSFTPGSKVSYQLNAPSAINLPYQVALSFSDVGGIVIPGMRRIDLRPDALFFTSLLVPGKPFEKFRGTLDANGNAIATLHLPALAQLKGTTICAAFVTLRAASPGGVYNNSATTIFQVK